MMTIYKLGIPPRIVVKYPMDMLDMNPSSDFIVRAAPQGIRSWLGSIVRNQSQVLADKFNLDNSLPDNTNEISLHYFLRGCQYMGHQEYPEAEIDFTRALSAARQQGSGDNKILARLLSWRGTARTAQGKYTAAEEDFAKIISLNEVSYTCYYSRGRVRAAQGKYNEALQDFEEALRNDSGSYLVYFARGNAKLGLDDYPGALGDYARVLKLQAEYVPAYNNLGVAKYRLGDNKGAIDDFNTALRLDSKYAGAYINRGVVKYELEDAKGAIEDYNKTLALDDKCAAAYKNRGFALINQDDYAAALADLETALALDKQKTADYYADKYKFSTFIPVINDVQEAAPARKKYSSYNEKGFAKALRGDYRGALADFNAALSNYGEGATAYHNRGLAKQRLGDDSGAIADLTIAIKLRDYASSFFHRGKSRLNLKDYRGALADFSKFTPLEAEHIDVYNNRGFAKQQLEDNIGAIEDYNRVLRLEPGNFYAYFNRASAHENLEDYEAAVNDYNKALDLEPQREELIKLYLDRAIAKQQLKSEPAKEYENVGVETAYPDGGHLSVKEIDKTQEYAPDAAAVKSVNQKPSRHSIRNS